MSFLGFSTSPFNSSLESQDRDQLLSTTRQLLAEVQALSSRIAAVNEIAVAINRSLELEEILQIVAKQAKWLIDFQHLSIYLCDQGSCRWLTLFGPEVMVNQAAIAPTGIISQTIQSRQPQIIQDSSNHFLSSYPSGMVIPLESQQQVLGSINFATTKVKAYTYNDIRISYLFASQIATAICNAQRFEELNQLYAQLHLEKRKSEELLLNILPGKIADELKQSGKVQPVLYESASVLFADFQDFTKLSERLSPTEIFDELNYCFSQFDQIVEKYNLEKLKTMGDGYLCVGGIPTANSTHAKDAVLAAMEMQSFLHFRNLENLKMERPTWHLRIGIHSGALLAGVIGQRKFAYDVWGDTVNTAARMESCGIAGKVNISESTYNYIKDIVEVEYRGKVAAKNKGDIDMYLVKRIGGASDTAERSPQLFQVPGFSRNCHKPLALKMI
jgi:class 3 adenylate cyclase